MDVGLVCDGCDSFHPMGAVVCSSCGAALSLADADTDGASSGRSKRGAGSAPGLETRCPACGAGVARGHAFCGACGAAMNRAKGAQKEERKAKTLFFGAMQQARAKLVLIKGDGLDGVSFTLAGEEHLAGRVNAPLLFDEDPFLSPTHANFLYRNGHLIVRDEGSVNGVFIRIRGARPVQPGAMFLVGEQLLEVGAGPDRIELGEGSDPGLFEDEPEADGTYFFASPKRGAQFRLVQRLRGGESGLAYGASGSSITVGREGNDIDFPEDPFISGHHAKVSMERGRLVLTDLGSKNGTFLRVSSEEQLNHGDYVFMGQQLLRVEIV